MPVPHPESLTASILVAAIGIAAAGCSASSDPEPRQESDAGQTTQAVQPSCADKNAVCAKRFAGSTALDCPGPTRTLHQRCVSSQSPADSDSWLCCVND